MGHDLRHGSFTANKGKPPPKLSREESLVQDFLFDDDIDTDLTMSSSALHEEDTFPVLLRRDQYNDSLGVPGMQRSRTPTFQWPSDEADIASRTASLSLNTPFRFDSFLTDSSSRSDITLSTPDTEAFSNHGSRPPTSSFLSASRPYTSGDTDVFARQAYTSPKPPMLNLANANGAFVPPGSASAPLVPPPHFPGGNIPPVNAAAPLGVPGAPLKGPPLAPVPPPAPFNGNISVQPIPSVPFVGLKNPVVPPAPGMANSGHLADSTSLRRGATMPHRKASFPGQAPPSRPTSPSGSLTGVAERRPSTGMPWQNTRGTSGAARPATAHPSVVAPGSLPHQPRPRASSRPPTQERPRTGGRNRTFNGKDVEALNPQDIREWLPSIARDQTGCRLLQRRLDDSDNAYKLAVIEETTKHFGQLMVDPFANYLTQKVFAVASEAQREAILKEIRPHLLSASLTPHGTRAVQSMIDHLTTDNLRRLLIAGLDSAAVVKLVTNLNGNHIIQRCLDVWQAPIDQFIYDAISQNCVPVASHRHGCCVFQRYISHADKPQLDQLIASITSSVLFLIQDAFGNYVVQYVLDMDNPSFATAVADAMIPRATDLATQKFSSNVVEKCLKVAPKPSATKLAAQILSSPSIDFLLRDNYANYVVQTALFVDPAALHDIIITNVKPAMSAISHMPYGRRILGKLQGISEFEDLL